MEQKSRWQRFKEWWTIDHVVDLCVDALLMLWDVITSPVLIVVRLIRHFFGEWIIGSIKAVIKSIVGWFARKRKIRLERGHGIFRTYWYLILTSPFIIFFLVLVVAMLTGLTESAYEVLDTFAKENPDSSFTNDFLK